MIDPLLATLGSLAACAALPPVIWPLVRRRYRLPTPADERLVASTKDGWELALYRYRPASPVPGREPALLCHGMLSNRYNVDLGEQSSLARHLRDCGIDTWVMELRGHGGSRRARRNGAPSGLRPFDWNLDDYIVTDLPAAFDRVMAETGASRVHWFGHSMGGMLLYAACALPGFAGRVRSASVSDAPATFEPLRARAPAGRLYARLFPAVPPALLLPYLGLATWVRPRLLEGRYGLQGRRQAMEVLANAIIPWGSSRALLHFVRILESGRFRSFDGRLDYEAGASAIDFPLLVMSAPRKMMPEAAVRAGFDRAATREKAYLSLSRASGMAIDYSHANLLIARSAVDDVYPRIARWMLDHSSA